MKENNGNALLPDISRRMFGRVALLATAGATLPFYNEATLAQLSRIGPLPEGAVKINANENPMGPCAEAAEAIHKVVQKGGRYVYEETDTFATTLAKQENVKAEYVMPLPAQAIRCTAVLAFTSPTKSLVMGDPVMRREAGPPSTSAPKSYGCRSRKIILMT
ncbi:MAG: hypothetical protein WKF30_05185 [Pyrinomonadaceae bacterium]